MDGLSTDCLPRSWRVEGHEGGAVHARKGRLRLRSVPSAGTWVGTLYRAL